MDVLVLQFDSPLAFRMLPRKSLEAFADLLAIRFAQQFLAAKHPRMCDGAANVVRNQPFVQHVLAMDTANFGAEPGTDLDPDVMWRAVENEALQDAAYVGVIVWEALTALVLLGSLRWWARGRSDGYLRARAASTIGLLMMLLLFLGGFIAIGGEWFQMWRSSDWNGLDPAFRNAVLAMVTLVIVQMTSPRWDQPPETT